MQYFRLIRSNIDVKPLLAEIEAHESDWLVNTARQDKIPVQRDTNAIFISSAVRRPDLNINENQESEFTQLSTHFPGAVRFMTDIAAELGGTLSRAVIIRLKPRSHVGQHVDGGSYYRIRDRYHLVLQSPAGSLLRSGGEQVCMQEGELWWFDNKQHHSAFNASDVWRIHYIFDVLPEAHRHLAANPLPPAGSGADTPGWSGDAAQSRREAELAVQYRRLTNALGQVTWLLSQSPRHRTMAVGDFERLILPPLQLGQCRMFHASGKLAGIALWALVSERLDTRLRSGQMRLEPADWRSGDRAWLVDMIAPFGGAEQMLQDLKANVFAGRPLALRRASGGVSTIERL